MIDKSVAYAVLEEALRTGGDYSELYMEDTENNIISMTDGKVEDALYSRLARCGRARAFGRG